MEYTISGSEIYISNSKISYNGLSSNYGDGVYSLYSKTVIKNSVISKNKRHGIFTDQATSADILNNWIVDNGDSTGSDYGINIYYPSSRLEIRNNTISQNPTGGIYRNGGVDPNVINCIIWNNGANNLSGTFGLVSYSCINNGYTGTGNISDDPNFIAPDANNFHISWDSPCINAGLTKAACYDEKDIDRENRVYNGVVDIGGDEVYYSIADLNEDELVNFVDYAVFAKAWATSSGQPNWDPNCDFKPDGEIDSSDLGEFACDWLWSPRLNSVPFEDEQFGIMMAMGVESEEMLMAAPMEMKTIERQPINLTQPDPNMILEILDWLDEAWLNDELDLSEEVYLEFRDAVESGY